MLFTFDVSFVELWQHLCHAGYWLIPIIGVWILIYGINAWAWWCIIKGNVGGVPPVSFATIYRLTISGYALNYATPVGGLGGEPYRIMELSKYIDNQHATSSVILYASDTVCYDAFLRTLHLLVCFHLHLSGSGGRRRYADDYSHRYYSGHHHRVLSCCLLSVFKRLSQGTRGEDHPLDR